MLREVSLAWPNIDSASKPWLFGALPLPTDCILLQHNIVKIQLVNASVFQDSSLFSMENYFQTDLVLASTDVACILKVLGLRRLQA